MLVTNGTMVHRYEEAIHEGMRLGRHLVLDARSLAYTVEEDVEAIASTVRLVSWPAPIPILNQGQLGSCTGNAGTAAAASLVGAAGLGSVKLGYAVLSANDADADETFAVTLYSDATDEDNVPGNYPPDDTGSSGLAICRVLHSAGIIGGYRWATTLRGIAALMQTRGVMVGMPWLNAFFEPDAHGFIDSGKWQYSGIAGGHEIYCEAIEAWDDRDPGKVVFRMRNSWAESWGDHGEFRMRGSTYQALRQQIDVKQLMPK